MHFVSAADMLQVAVMAATIYHPGQPLGIDALVGVSTAHAIRLGLPGDPNDTDTRNHWAVAYARDYLLAIDGIEMLSMHVGRRAAIEATYPAIYAEIAATWPCLAPACPDLPLDYLATVLGSYLTLAEYVAA